jgi:hypothetical protein
VCVRGGESGAGSGRSDALSLSITNTSMLQICLAKGPGQWDC